MEKSSLEARGVFRIAVVDLGFRVDLPMVVAQFFVQVNGLFDDRVFLDTVRQLSIKNLPLVATPTLSEIGLSSSADAYF